MTTLMTPPEIEAVPVSRRDPVGIEELKRTLPRGADVKRVHVGGAIRSRHSIMRFLGSSARGEQNRVSVDFLAEQLLAHPGFDFAPEAAMLTVAVLSPEQLELPGSRIYYGDVMLNAADPESARPKRWNLSLCPSEAVVQLALLLIGQKPGEHVYLVMKPLGTPGAPLGYGGIFAITTDAAGRHVKGVQVTPGTRFSEHHRFAFLVPDLRHGDASVVPNRYD